MDAVLKQKIADFFKIEFATELKEKIQAGHTLADFNVHPFNVIALASGYLGKTTPENMAKALLYPRVLGTSITTKFGDKMQKMCVTLLPARPSAVPGMDFEYDDKVENQLVFMQLKAGPNTINSDDVEPMLEKMRSAYRLLRQNRAKDQSMPIFTVGITYGAIQEISSHYKNIHKASVMGQEGVPIYIGKDFWHRLTGEEGFYNELISIFIDLFEQEDYSAELQQDVVNLTAEIEQKYFTEGKFDPSKI